MKTKSLRMNAALNVIKQCCAIIFPLITFPYVSRVIGTEGFGQYNFSFSIADYFIIFAALGIHSYAIREGAKNRNDKALTDRFCCEVFTINITSMLISVCGLSVHHRALHRCADPGAYKHIHLRALGE